MAIGATQRGMTRWGLLLVIPLVAFFLQLAFHLVPVYLEDIRVAKALETLNTGGPDPKTKEILRDQLLRRFEVNDVHSVRSENIGIIPLADGFAVNVAYEVRVPIVANIATITHFYHHRDVH